MKVQDNYQTPVCISDGSINNTDENPLPSKIDLKQINNNTDDYKTLQQDSPEMKNQRQDSPNILSPQLNKDSFFARKVYPLEIYWENLTVTQTKNIKTGFRKYKKQETTILHNLKGCCKPHTMTSILGPSGDDKTVLLNLLSGRLTNSEMSATGTIKFNNIETKDPEKFSNLVAYIQQNDILFAVFTPREAFKFASELRLKMDDSERNLQIESLIKDLGLTHCADTRIGNTMLRGISGGERKRTSIGVELLTNPSLIFLDEPTTGLDSSTAYNVMDLLKRIAQNGRTVISTIHQPSCDIFNNFDQLILIVDGKIIYSGKSQDSLDYFAHIGFPTKKFSNPADNFVQIMTPDGFLVEKLKEMAQLKEIKKITIDRDQIESDFLKRVNFFVEKYQESQNYKAIAADPNSKQINTKLLSKQNNISSAMQFYLVFKRTIQSAIKNPYETRMKICQAFVISLLLLIVFWGLGEGRTGIQNRNGAMFFISLNCLFGGVNGVLTIFSWERPLYLRESMNRSYNAGSYFLGKSLADIPFQILFITIMSLLSYFPLGFNLEDPSKFFIFYIILLLAYFVSSSYGLCLSTLIESYEFAVSMVPITVVPQTVLAGFMASEDQIPIFLKPFEYISIPKYSYQALTTNEFTDLPSDKLIDTIYCKDYPDNICQPLNEANFELDMWPNIFILLGLGIALQFLAYIGLKVIAAPKRIIIQ